MGGTAWVTLATNDSYALGALVVANSLKRVNTVHDLVILITPGVTLAMKNELLRVFNFVKEVDVFDSRDETNLRLLSRPDLGITFTKIHAWRLTQYSKCVFLDADVLIVQNCDELFDREELSAAPDAGWPDCFNSGVFVFKPSDSTYNALVEFALVNGSFDGGDQGLLNLYFSNWATADSSKRLSFVYNMCSTSTYTYLPALKQFGSKVKIIHFIGSSKPWLQHFDSTTRTILSGDSHLTNFLQLWWDVFVVHVHPTLTTEMSGLARALAQVPIGTPISAEQLAYEDHIHRQHWEEGHIDYLGKDSWDNIWKKISQTIDPVKPAESAEATAQTTEPSPVTSQSTPSAGPQPSVEKASPPTTPEVKPPVSSESVPATPAALVPEPASPAVAPAVPTESQPAPVPPPAEAPVSPPADLAPAVPVETPTAPTVSTESQATSVEAPVTVPAPAEPTATPVPISAGPVEAPALTPTGTPTPTEYPVAPPPTPVEGLATPLSPPESPVAPPSSAPAASAPSSPAVAEAAPPSPAEVTPPSPAAPAEATAPSPDAPAEAAPVAAPSETASPSVISAAVASAVTMAAAPAVSSASAETSASLDTPQVTPSTPTVTSPTPPQSPLSVVASKLEKLDIDASIPETPPAGGEPPVPPKRKGSKDSQGGKSGKGKK
uniref:glycogenin glucosyltransferase n=1 Tax=Cacopsylla melanoneura TaxID=428564 RepID=A0A8D8TGB6_9HEMI